MIILPAIDIKDGNCVRLQKGDFSTVVTVADSYMVTAKNFQNDGAEWIHMVDLDGAKSGFPVNSEIFLDVAKNTNLKVELGGGIRDLKTVDFYLNNGISRVILGSVALKNPLLVGQAVAKYGDKIAVGIDALDEKVAVEGWLDGSEVNYLELAIKMCNIGVKHIIFTDISKDGMLSGPNLEQLSRLNNAVDADIIASGGICNINDIYNCKANNLYGVICGKSLYSGTLRLKEAIKIAKGGGKCLQNV